MTREVIRFRVRDVAVGVVLGALLGGSGVSLIVGVAPDSAIARAVAGAFAGSACRHVESDMHECRVTLQCVKALATQCVKTSLEVCE